MSRKPVDHAGSTFGKLTVTGFDSSKKKWSCVCTCGRHVLVATACLTRGFTKSCGCLQRPHGHCPRGKMSPEYSTWYSMIARCRYRSHKAYAHYAERGISVCERWQKFENFLADMGSRPAGMTLERIDNDGNYEPCNCRWATQQEQLNNQRKTIFVEYLGKRMSFSDAWRASGSHINRDAAYGRFRRGWALEKALSAPMGADR
jgi:hypothetical protein